MSFISFIQDQAREAGWPKVRVMSDTLVALPFASDEGTINLYIQPCGKLGGKTVIEFSSTGLPLAEDIDLKLSMLEFFMRRNGELLFGHWGIESNGDKQECCMMVTQIAETMDPAEFRSAVEAVVNEFEKFMTVFRKASQKGKIDF